MANNHEYRGLCDLCGQEAESEVAEVVGLTCSFKDCAEEKNLYHQACVEKYLKSIKCEKNRKSGFNCPRGCGKATTYPEKCKGKITKSHPVTIRSEGNKKRRQAELESFQKLKGSPTPASSSKSDKKSAAAVADNSRKGEPVPTKPVIIRALNVANARLTNLPPPKTAAELQREALQAARDKLRAEIATNNKQPLSGGSSLTSSSTAAAHRSTRPGGGVSSSPATKQVMTLDEYMAARSASSASTAGGASTATHKLNDTTRSSSAASSFAPSAAAAAAAGGDGNSSRPSMVTNAWSRMTSLGDHTNHSATILPSSTQSVESFPKTPGRETLSSSSCAPSEEYAPAAYAGLVSAPMAAVRVPAPSATAAMAAPSTGPGSAWTTPRAGVTPSAGATPPAGATAASVFSSSLKEIIPGMIDHSKLTKAQRKNLKRAEKKAALRSEETCSLVSCATATTGATTEGDDPHPHLHSQPNHQCRIHEKDEDASQQHALNMDTNNYLGETPPLQPASPVTDSFSSGGNTARSSDSMSQESLECLVQFKLNKAITLLVSLGFNYEASARTAVACGGDVHNAMQDLLVAESGAESVYPSGTETPVDISEDLTIVQLLKERYGGVFPPSTVDAVIVQCFGNLEEVGSRLQVLARNCKMQQQEVEMQDQQALFYGSRTIIELSDAESNLVPSSGDDGGGIRTANGGGLGSLFGDTFGLPDELTWGQSGNSQHPTAACSSNEWTSLLGGRVKVSGNGSNEAGSLFGTDSTAAAAAADGPLGLGFDTTKQQNLSSQQHSLFANTGPGLGLGFSTPASLPAYQQQQQQHQMIQQSAPQRMPGISQQQQQEQQQLLGSSNFSSNTVLSNGGGLWGSASTIGSSFGAASGGGYYGGISNNNNSTHAAVGMTRPSYDANNNTNNGESGCLNHITPPGSAAGYGMIKNSDGVQGIGEYQQSYSYQQQQQQMHYSGNAAAGMLWQQQQQQVRSSFDGNQTYSNTDYYATSPRNNPGAAVGGGNSFNGGSAAAGYPGSMMMAMAQEQQQQQARHDQHEIQSLMGNLGLYSS